MSAAKSGRPPGEGSHNHVHIQILQHWLVLHEYFSAVSLLVQVFKIASACEKKG
jgi:hypothetical protein